MDGKILILAAIGNSVEWLPHQGLNDDPVSTCTPDPVGQAACSGLSLVQPAGSGLRAEGVRMMAEYPSRPKFFCLKFSRLMAKLCLANEIGADACWLLTVIAGCEDARGYVSHVTYFNEQLAPLVGLGSVDALARVRHKAISAGWLDYTPGGKGKAGRYAVQIPPQFCGRSDGAFDEDPAEYLPQKCGDNREESAETTARKVRRQPRDNRETSAEHSYPTPNPIPIPNTNTPQPPRGRTRRIALTADGILKDLTIPEELQGIAATGAIKEWLRHKDRIRNQYAGPESFQKELFRWAKLGAMRFVAAVDYSIGKEWKGIYEEKQDAPGGGQQNNGRRVKYIPGIVPERH